MAKRAHRERRARLSRVEPAPHARVLDVHVDEQPRFLPTQAAPVQRWERRLVLKCESRVSEAAPACATVGATVGA